MSRSRLGDFTLPISKRTALMVTGILITAVIVGSLVLFVPRPPLQYSQSGVQFYYDDQPVGDPIWSTNLPGGWQYNGEEVNKAKFMIEWEANATTGSYVVVTIYIGTGTGSYPQDIRLANQPLQGGHSRTKDLYQILPTNLNHGETTILGADIEFELYDAGGNLLDAEGKHIQATLMWSDPTASGSGAFLLTSVTITPYEYIPDILP